MLLIVDVKKFRNSILTVIKICLKNKNIRLNLNAGRSQGRERRGEAIIRNFQRLITEQLQLAKLKTLYFFLA